VPNGRRLDVALQKLEFMVSIDIYRNETTRHAHLILPTSVGLEREHYPLVFGALSVHNAAKYAAPVLPAPAGVRHDWQVLLGITSRLVAARGGRQRLLAPVLRALGRVVPPRRALDLLLRFGPHKLTLAELERQVHGVDLGPLEPRLTEILRGRRIELLSEPILGDFRRLERKLTSSTNGGLVLIGRRHLRSNNSWMHNLAPLVAGQNRCNLLVHPDDAAARGIADGDRVRLESRVGSIQVEAELSDEVARGVVSLPHGWGHDRAGVALGVASRTRGASLNDVTDETLVDELSGCAALSGVPVTVAAVK
jgi:anaerobic selenocysteine-containing dehydrogenase